MDGTAAVAALSAKAGAPRRRGQEIGGRCSGARLALAMAGLAGKTCRTATDTIRSTVFATSATAGGADGHIRIAQALEGMGCGCSGPSSFIVMLAHGISTAAAGGVAQVACTGPASARPRTAKVTKNVRNNRSILLR